jgi:hypothetical protein
MYSYNKYIAVVVGGGTYTVLFKVVKKKTKLGTLGNNA